MWDVCGQLNMPVAIHVSDPVAFFTPTDRFNERYEELNNHPDWSFYDGDFPGSDFQNIRRYKEFEISPQGEWVDLDIDLSKPHHEDGWTWNSGATLRQFETGFESICFVVRGPPPNRIEVVWQPTMSHTFHTPERFGMLRLVAEEPK